MPRPIEHALDDIFYRRANLDNFGDKKAPPFGSEKDDDDDEEGKTARLSKLDWLDDEGNEVEDSDEQKQRNRDWDDDLDDDNKKTSGWIHTAPGGGVHGPYEIEKDGDGYEVVNNRGESKGTHDTKEEAREQQKALYVNVPEAQEQAESKKKSSRRRLADSNIVYAGDGDDQGSDSGPTFSPPRSVSGSWSCNDCGADDLGVHDLNGHAEAHRQTTHRAGYALFL